LLSIITNRQNKEFYELNRETVDEFLTSALKNQKKKVMDNLPIKVVNGIGQMMKLPSEKIE